MLNYRSFAQVILVGVLGHNAQVRQTKSGSAMLTFSVATKSSVKQATGGYQTVTTWHDCLMFGPRSEKLASALLKGTVVSLQGSLNYREVELKNGYKGKTCSILVEDVQILAEGKAQELRPPELPVRPHRLLERRMKWFTPRLPAWSPKTRSLVNFKSTVGRLPFGDAYPRRGITVSLFSLIPFRGLTSLEGCHAS